jgi:hypothetical protein
MRVLGDSSRVGHAGFASPPPLSGPSNCDFALSNGVFARVFPLAPASAAYVGLGAVILGSGVLHRTFGYVAVGLGLAFEVGILALFTIVGLILAIILSVAQEIWVIVAAVAVWRPARSPR